MIISHSRKFIFIKTLKTGGTSLEMVLSRYCAPGDILTPLIPDEEKQRRSIAGIGAQNYHRPLSEYGWKRRLKFAATGRREYKYGEHSPAWLVRRRVGEDVWRSYFKFTVVRNPFDRCISRYFYTRRYFDEDGTVELWDRQSFDQFLRYCPEQINENWAMYTEKDRVILDQVIRYEQLREGLGEVSRRIGLPHNIHDDMQGVRAKGGVRPGSARSDEMISDSNRSLIAALCSKEMQTFGYA